MANAGSSIDLRHYLLKKRAIAKGESIQNLNGIYWFVGMEASLVLSENLSVAYNPTGLNNATYISPTLGLGAQTKMGSRHFVDIYGKLIPLERETVSFGLKFGFSK